MSITNTGSTPLLYPGGLGNKCLHSGGPFLTTGSKTQPTNPVFRNGNFVTGIRILTITWWTLLLVWNASRPAHKLLREISQPQADPVYIYIYIYMCVCVYLDLDSFPPLLCISPLPGHDPQLRGFEFTFIAHATLGRTPLDRWSARHRDYLTIRNTHKRHIPPHGGIRTRNPKKRAPADTRIRSRGHWDRRVFRYAVTNEYTVFVRKLARGHTNRLYASTGRCSQEEEGYMFRLKLLVQRNKNYSV